MNMTEKRNPRIALLAVIMLLSGALLGLISEDVSATDNDVVGFISSDSPSGVSVTFINQETGASQSVTSSLDGSYSFNNLDDGEYSVRYSKVGFLSVLGNWSIPSDLPLNDIAMYLAPAGSTSVTVNVKDDEGIDINGATVSLMSATTEDSWWADVSVGYTVSNSTEVNGNSSFDSLTSDQYEIRVEASGYATTFGNTTDTNIVMSALDDNNKQTVRVYDPSGNPLGDSTVFMYDATSSTWYDADKVGYTYYLQPSAGSEVYVYAYHASYNPSVAKIALVSGPATHNMDVGSNSAANDGIVYLNSAPSQGAQSMAPMYGDRMIKLNSGPTASIDVSGTTDLDGSHVIAAGSTVNFTGSSSTSPVGGLTYSWDSSSGVDYSSSFDAGDHTITLAVTDAFGASNSASVTIMADGVNPVPNFTATVKSGTDDEGSAYNETNVEEDYTTVVFDASSSTDAVGIDSYSWDFGDESTDTGNVTNHIFANPGDFDVILTVTDAAGNNDSKIMTISVKDITIPSAEFSWSYTNETGGMVTGAAMEGEPTHFNATGSTDNSGENLSYGWDFGDGITDSNAITQHIFANLTGDGFNVVLTVTDTSGNADVISYNIKPAQKQRPDLYISELSFSNDNPTAGSTVTFEATVKLLGMNITDSFDVGFFLDTADGEQIGSVIVDGSNMSFGIEHGFNVSTTWKATSGPHTIVVVADTTNAIDESEEKNDLSKVITVSSEDDSSEVTSMVMIIAVVLLSVGSVGYIYRDSLFSK
jgi:hypothetical protein